MSYTIKRYRAVVLTTAVAGRGEAEYMSDQYIGIDGGGTLSKIVYAKGNDWGYKKIATSKFHELHDWFKETFDDPYVQVTGGKAGALMKELPFAAKKINEFEATCEGVKWQLERSGLINKTGDRFIVANVGTGTSIHMVDQDSYERIGGSGMGGGTLLGLSYLLTGEDEFDRILTLGEQGDGRKLNVTVGDIYSHEPPPISGDLTASNFGDLAQMKQGTHNKEDYIATVVRMIGETITTMSVQAADRIGTDAVIYIGTTFSNHNTLQSIMTQYTELRGKKAYFLENGEFSGAIGALLNKGLKKAVLR